MESLAPCLSLAQPPSPSASIPLSTPAGGHTAEMLKLLDHLLAEEGAGTGAGAGTETGPAAEEGAAGRSGAAGLAGGVLAGGGQARYSPRCYVVAATDPMSGAKALARERLWQKTDSPSGFSIRQIPRSREVGQSYLTSVATTLYSLLFAFRLVLEERPDLVLVNGPGTCIPVCAAAFTYRVLGLARSQVVYVESIARTRRFSLSAKLLYHLRLADLLLVQWEALASTYPRAVYAGRLY
ncbi:UDP-N-acetylglucosamine transferase subunit ALG14 [Tetrabaena socialis]|uniref:UDP-N-acetylglucosamine transferase subunit ALG14 n=1 Tax=Tetrabaena socialis TaxID=47790 RepID=A0A2J7ZX06_9CHLO|nr:UDP-N-acetylglucosamine transferase subunit ALG14 [Tetrabaena socialis]|eukprot:PNH04785.1 UDP-N-acetylglucosamine transferase subunit ALG14 [Tetrabaena socialis]